MNDHEPEKDQPRRAKCAVCREQIEGYPSILQPGTTTWLGPRSGEGYGHLHTPQEATR